MLITTTELTDEEFTAALNAEDHLGMVIRAHIHLEHWLERLLLTCIPHYAEYAKHITPDYETKVHLCCALGLTESLKPALKAVGSLRNSFAHKPNYTLRKSDVDNIYGLLTAEHKAQLQSTYTGLAHEFRLKETRYAELPLERKLNILIMFMRSQLKMTNERAQVGRCA